jgi:hypothetical protein
MMGIRASLLVATGLALAGCAGSMERREGPDKPGNLAEPTIAGKDSGKGGFFGPSQRLPEIEVPLPEAPRDADLVAVRLRDTTSGKVRIDGRTLRVDTDMVVRYVVVITSSGGVRNTRYEAVRCDPNEGKRIAIGRSDGSWGPVSRPEWAPVDNVTYNAVQFSLAKDYFCGPSGAPRKKDEILAMIRRDLVAPSKPSY